MTISKAQKLAGLMPFVKAYIDCAFWLCTDESTPSGGYPLDRSYDLMDLTHQAIDKMVCDCEAFWESNAEDLADLWDDQSGHDFWLSRNGHGAGFWDRGLGEVGDRLHNEAKTWGESTLYLYRGRIYAS